MNFQIQSAVTSSYLTSAPIEDLSQVATTPFPVLTNSFTHFHFLFFTLTFYLSLHLLLSWRSQPTRRTWPPPSTSSSSPSRSSTHASSSTQSSAQSEHEKFFFILVKIPTSSPGDQQPKANRPKAPVITNFYYSNLGANKLYL